MLSAGRGRPARTPFGFLIWALPVVVPASKCGVCCLSLVSPRIGWRVGGTSEMRVEAFFPKGGGCIKLASSSGWSRVLRIDPVGGPPHCDFANQGSGKLPHRSPDRRPLTVADVILDLLGEVGDKLGQLCQVDPPEGIGTER